jgi:hypothetical protein
VGVLSTEDLLKTLTAGRTGCIREKPGNLRRDKKEKVEFHNKIAKHFYLSLDIPTYNKDPWCDIESLLLDPQKHLILHSTDLIQNVDNLLGIIAQRLMRTSLVK